MGLQTMQQGVQKTKVLTQKIQYWRRYTTGTAPCATVSFPLLLTKPRRALWSTPGWLGSLAT